MIYWLLLGPNLNFIHSGPSGFFLKWTIWLQTTERLRHHHEQPSESQKSQMGHTLWFWDLIDKETKDHIFTSSAQFCTKALIFLSLRHFEDAVSSSENRFPTTNEPNSDIKNHLCLHYSLKTPLDLIRTSYWTICRKVSTNLLFEFG